MPGRIERHVDRRHEHSVDARPIGGIQPGDDRGELTRVGVRIDDQRTPGPEVLHFRPQRVIVGAADDEDVSDAAFEERRRRDGGRSVGPPGRRAAAPSTGPSGSTGPRRGSPGITRILPTRGQILEARKHTVRGEPLTDLLFLTSTVELPTLAAFSSSTCAGSPRMALVRRGTRSELVRLPGMSGVSFIGGYGLCRPGPSHAC